MLYFFLYILCNFFFSSDHVVDCQRSDFLFDAVKAAPGIAPCRLWARAVKAAVEATDVRAKFVRPGFPSAGEKGAFVLSLQGTKLKAAPGNSQASASEAVTHRRVIRSFTLKWRRRAKGRRAMDWEVDAPLSMVDARRRLVEYSLCTYTAGACAQVGYNTLPWAPRKGIFRFQKKKQLCS